MLPPAQIDMLSNLVLQSNAAINRYLVERQGLHTEITTLNKHKVGQRQRNAAVPLIPQSGACIAADSGHLWCQNGHRVSVLVLSIMAVPDFETRAAVSAESTSCVSGPLAWMKHIKPVCTQKGCWDGER